MKGKKPIIAAIVASCVLGSAVLYTTVSGRIEEAPEPEPSSPRPVRTEIVTELSEVSSRSFPGTVRATGRVDLAFSVDGLLAELHATEGTLVKKGDVVAQLDQRDAQNAYQASRARYEVAQKDFDRANAIGLCLELKRAIPNKTWEHISLPGPHKGYFIFKLLSFLIFLLIQLILYSFLNIFLFCRSK